MSEKESIEHLPHRQLTTVTLTAEQFESLYMQPRTSGSTWLVGRVGNPTPLYVSFLFDCCTSTDKAVVAMRANL